MKMCKLLLSAGLIVLAQPLVAQGVKLANIALGMSESAVKTALNSNTPSYADQASDYPEMHYLVAETEMESYAFTLIEGKVVGFSVVHILPPGQLPFLSPGQQPTVSILRGLVTKQTWSPAEINKGDTLWFSDASGAFSLMLCSVGQSPARRGCPSVRWQAPAQASLLRNPPRGS